MSDVRPFRALRPRDDLAGDIIAPPYDVLTEAEARALAKNRKSFVRVTRSEVDLPAGADAHSDVAYRKAKENLDQFVRDEWLQLDDQETFYLYAQTMGDHHQVCVLGGASVEEYDDGRIAKHEFTRPDKEDDRTHHMDVLDAQVGLVFLGYVPTPALKALMDEGQREPAAWRVRTEDGVVHELRPQPPATAARWRAAFAEVPRLYVCDGHHRSAAASRIHKLRNSPLTAHFLVGMFPADHLKIMAYNRVVKDLQGLTPEGLLGAIRAMGWSVTPGGSPTPAARGQISMYLAGAWYTLAAGPALQSTDPVKGLDVSVLQDHLLAPILGIDDPRRSKRIDFVGGIRGPAALTAAVDAGGGVAFSMFATSIEQLFAVADAGDVMPPKSTWFEPKLREGVVIRLLS
jgi:uncharacterized protein (DUF1015 family)